MASDRGKPGMFGEWEIVLPDGHVIWEGVADGQVDAMATWLERDTHKAAVLLVEGHALPVARRI